MRQRILTALLLLPLAIAAVLYLPTPWLGGLTTLLLLLALWEWSRLVGVRGLPARLAFLAANVALMSWLAWSAAAWHGLALGVVVVGALWWLLAAAWLRRIAFLSLDTLRARALKLVAGALAVVPAWAALLLLHGDGALGPRWALTALVSVWAADSFAYFIGSRWGRTKLAPSISPGKTWAGFWGGLGGCMLLTLLAAPLLGVGWLQLPALALLAAITGVFSVLGDLFESLIKRHAGSKDSGDLIPGHGGVLDRVDSLLAALPAFLVVKLWLGL